MGVSMATAELRQVDLDSHLGNLYETFKGQCRKQGYIGLHGHVNSSMSVFPGFDTKKLDTAVRRGHPKLWATVQDLTICSNLVTPLPGFSLRVKSLHQRAARLENNLFSVALFEGRAKMQETVIKLIQPKIKAWLNECSGDYKGFWHELFELECKNLKEQTHLEVSGYYSRLATALGNGYDLNYLEQVRGELARLVDESNFYDGAAYFSPLKELR